MSSDGVSTEAVFAALAGAFAADPAIGNKLGGVLRFVISADGRQVLYTIDGTASSVRPGDDGRADCMVTIAEHVRPPSHRAPVPATRHLPTAIYLSLLPCTHPLLW